MLGSNEFGYKEFWNRVDCLQRSEMIPKSSVLIYCLDAQPLYGRVMSINA